MYSAFKYETVKLKDIALDDRNPRIVTPAKLSSQIEILQYLYENDDLEGFIKKIAAEGKNAGAERPYVVKSPAGYTVIEGNTRIAAYKVLTGLLKPPKDFATSIPQISPAFKASLLSVDCSIAPNRDTLLPIMANAHFGLGDKSKWGYLGSRKAVYEEWKAGKSIPKLAKAFDRTQGQIRELILEYLLYTKALTLNWTKSEKEALLRPAVQFNPPVRFLQTSGHKDKVGVSYDSTNLKVNFQGAEAEKKFKHLILKLVVAPQSGLGATATYDEVFKDYKPANTGKTNSPGANPGGSGSSGKGGSGSGGGTSSPGSSGPGAGAAGGKLKATSLFAYPTTMNNALIAQLMREAKDLNYKKFPAAATFLLRNIVEAILKHIIDLQKANPASKLLDLEGSLNLCAGNTVTLLASDKKILQEFRKSHLPYLNLGAHGNLIPNPDRVMGARDCIDQFVKRNV